MNLDEMQAALQQHHLEGWLFYDHHHRDPIAYSILELDPEMHVTRRWFYFVPSAGRPQKLVHRIEAGRLSTLPGEQREYSSWQELQASIADLLNGCKRIAMQYSPNNSIPAVSMVDAGTVEMLRTLGKEIVSSADLVSEFEAVLSTEQQRTHFAAQEKVDRVLEAAWKQMGDRVRNGGSDEFAIVQWISEAMRREGLVWEHGPNVSCKGNSADSHYEPTADHSAPIRSGDFVLIDLWAKLPEARAVYYDITWTGTVDREPSARERMIFDTVRAARDAAIQKIQNAFAETRPIAGFEADDAARCLIRGAGYGEQFTHRTGHNIGVELHGAGANLDNLETHDVRRILPNTCFSVEPGIYFPGEFGIRSEVNMMTGRTSAKVTGRVQSELVRI